MTSRVPTEPLNDRPASSVVRALFTPELMAWPCVRCGAVCCISPAEQHTCPRCGASYALQRLVANDSDAP